MNENKEHKEEEQEKTTTKLEQVSVHLTEEIVGWIAKQVEQRQEVGLRVSVSEVVRECIYAGSRSVSKDTELLLAMPAGLRCVLGKKKRGLNL